MIAFIFWAVASGLAAGTGVYSVAFLGTLFIGITVVVFNILGVGTKTYLLILKAEDGLNDEALEELLDSVAKKYRLRMKNSSEGMSEMIYELSPFRGQESVIVDKAAAIQHIKAANLVSSNEDV